MLYQDIQQDPKLDHLRAAWVEFVPGLGPIDADLMIIGEAPGRLENARKTPFVGPAGLNLLNLLEDVDINSQRVFLTNAVKYWPYMLNPDGSMRTRTPESKDIELFREYLFDEIDIVKPRLVALAGNVASQAIFPKMSSYMHQHGKLIDGKFVIVYHPAVISYQAHMKSKVKYGYSRLKNHLDALMR
jgi:uracil-DNA glycosylase family 4